MSVKMIVEFRRRPSLARQKAVKAEKAAELDRIVQEELRRAWVGIDPGSRSTGIVTFRNGVQVV